MLSEKDLSTTIMSRSIPRFFLRGLAKSVKRICVETSLKLFLPQRDQFLESKALHLLIRNGGSRSASLSFRRNKSIHATRAHQRSYNKDKYPQHSLPTLRTTIV